LNQSLYLTCTLFILGPAIISETDLLSSIINNFKLSTHPFLHTSYPEKLKIVTIKLSYTKNVAFV
ncbi:MAG: hypothetical protein ABF682_10505, partial [Liquorilactobacillus sp.]|uniref:hypothetical protein n=1 Tax=Liquorilactobacillus sp. TaxID=2767923 RepID=UPI0039EBF0FC